MRSIKPMLRYAVQQYAPWTARVGGNTTGRDVTPTGSTKNRVANCFRIERYFWLHRGAMTIDT